MKKDTFKSNKMQILSISILLLLFASCANNGEGKKANTFENKVALSSNDSIGVLRKPATSQEKSNKAETNGYKVVDTVSEIIKIHFDFNGLSNEGGEGYAFYNKQNKKIIKSVITLYEERGRTEIEYNFKSEKIEAIEKEYHYIVPIGEVKSDTEIKLDTSFTYIINLMGSLDNNSIFSEFKSIVPFELR